MTLLAPPPWPSERSCLTGHPDANSGTCGMVPSPKRVSTSSASLHAGAERYFPKISSSLVSRSGRPPRQVS